MYWLASLLTRCELLERKKDSDGGNRERKQCCDFKYGWWWEWCGSGIDGIDWDCGILFWVYKNAEKRVFEFGKEIEIVSTSFGGD